MLGAITTYPDSLKLPAEGTTCEQTYEPFSPDSDLLMTRAFTPDDADALPAFVDSLQDVMVAHLAQMRRRDEHAA